MKRLVALVALLLAAPAAPAGAVGGHWTTSIFATGPGSDAVAAALFGPK